MLKSCLLPVVVAGLLSSIYVLPQVGDVAPSAVNMKIPERRGDWYVQSIPPSEAEINTLAKDTEFAKAMCLAPRYGEYGDDGRLLPNRVDLSIVLSGYDLNNSIHRPERCMPAQGHRIIGSSIKHIDVGKGRSLEVRRLLSQQRIPLNEDHTEYQEMRCLTYYFFVGNRQITSDHLKRTLFDMKDRLLYGIDQRWAYVTASTWFGKLPWLENEVSEAEADELLENFLREMAAEQLDWEKLEARLDPSHISCKPWYVRHTLRADAAVVWRMTHRFGHSYTS